MEKLFDEAQSEYKKTAQLYAENPKILQPEQFFENVATFINHFEVMALADDLPTFDQKAVKDIDEARIKEEKARKRAEEAEKRRQLEEEKKIKREEERLRKVNIFFT